MNVSELITKLQKYPPDLLVTVDGYEGGVTELKPEYIEHTKVIPNTNHRYCGEHTPDKLKGTLNVLNIGR
jgi:hypothetical protein